jgi:hypothetical protein
MAEVVGLELRNVVANYPFERSNRFPGSGQIQATEIIRVWAAPSVIRSSSLVPGSEQALLGRVPRPRDDRPKLSKSRNERKKVEMRFAHLKTHHGFERMRLRGFSGARDEFHLAAIVQAVIPP